MDNFACIYKILNTLEKAMDYSEFNIEEIGYERLGISEERWIRYIEMMSDVGLIQGITVKTYIDGERAVVNDNIRITLKGLEYLTENSLMQKAYKIAKGIKDIVPMI